MSEPDRDNQARSRYYMLLGRLLARPPDRMLLDMLRGFDGDRGPVGAALDEVALASAETDECEARRAYETIFIGVSRGELIPYASYYLTGFVAERPLAKLRSDMALLGIARAEGVHESEDHIAALCEMMAGMLTGAFGTRKDLRTESDFFEAHLAHWAPRFFEDLSRTRHSKFYAAVGGLGSRFMDVENALLRWQRGRSL
ncbi:MAG: molecular chaperone TorD family protein [Alphaproteobacteria bacterium]